MGLFDKNGLFTKFVEAVPGGGLITGPIHMAAGHKEHGAKKATQGAAKTMAAMAGALAGGPVGIVGAGVVSAALVDGAIDHEESKK
jgi:hypothetical protein